MFIGREVDIVAPFGPPRGADEELSIAEATKVGLQYERVLNLSQCQLLLAFKCVLDRLLEVLEEKFLDDLLLLSTAQVLAVITAHFLFDPGIILVNLPHLLTFTTLTLAALLQEDFLGGLAGGSDLVARFAAGTALSERYGAA